MREEWENSCQNSLAMAMKQDIRVPVCSSCFCLLFVNGKHFGAVFTGRREVEANNIQLGKLLPIRFVITLFTRRLKVCQTPGTASGEIMLPLHNDEFYHRITI